MDVHGGELAVGGRIGAYLVRYLLGRGAMGTVFACRHTVLGRSAAIKMLHSHLARDPVARARFLREGQAIAKVRHPYVVEIFDVGEHDGIPYLVMDLVEGDDIATWMRQNQPLPIADAVDCLLGIAAGVAAIHDAGVIHRDLKPSNIRLARDHRGQATPRILDFGISKVFTAGNAPDLTGSDAALGTIRYMAPEQLCSAKGADARSDVYALGVILYELMTGDVPFSGVTPYASMHAALTEPLTPARALRPDVPEALDAVISRALGRDPGERFPSARHLGEALVPFSQRGERWRRELASAGEERLERTERPVVEPITVLSTTERPRSRLAAVAIVSAAIVTALLAASARRWGSGANAAPSARLSAPAAQSSVVMATASAALQASATAPAEAPATATDRPLALPSASAGAKASPSLSGQAPRPARPAAPKADLSPKREPSTKPEAPGKRDVYDHM